MILKEWFKTFLLSSLHFIHMPELKLSKGEIEEFEQLYNKYVQQCSGNEIHFTSKSSKYLFLNYLAENKNLLIHGSNNQNIEVFEPREQSLFTGKIVKAVFAASDGVWPLYFAIINRSIYSGSLRNACFTTSSKNGTKRFYYFSLNKDFKDFPWCEGMVYILPRTGFVQGGIKNEWICEKEVIPLAKLKVYPADFPFINNVKKHKETDSIAKMMIKSFFNI